MNNRCCGVKYQRRKIHIALSRFAVGERSESCSVWASLIVGELRRGGHPALSDSSDDIQARKWEAREYLGWAMRPVDHGSGKLGGAFFSN
jgi:hypothetical protein